ncbi:MAG: type II toxin-antitoxin system RelE/ParE family toxin [Candidatus Magasanikbacteria bacterium]|nr:type II toxin-antitoxin system RelE/ParE family toxin [Candidatus Magasanikbacteria bacterium]
MKVKMSLTTDALKDLKKIDTLQGRKILSKLAWFEKQEDTLSYAKWLYGKDKQVRFRIGVYRAIGIVKEDTVYIIAVGHRKDIYK